MPDMEKDGVFQRTVSPSFKFEYPIGSKKSRNKTFKEIMLECGTTAYRTDFTWLLYNTVPMTTFLVSAYKDGKCIFLWADTWIYHDKFEPIVQSLTLK